VKISKRLRGVLRDWPWTSRGTEGQGGEPPETTGTGPDLGERLRQAMTEVQGRATEAGAQLGEGIRQAIGQLSERLTQPAQAEPPEGADAAWADASQGSAEVRPGTKALTPEPAKAPKAADVGGTRRAARPAAAVKAEGAGAQRAPAKPRHAGRRSPKAKPPTTAPQVEPGAKSPATPRNALVLIPESPEAPAVGGRASAQAPGPTGQATARKGPVKRPLGPRTRGDTHLDLARESLRDLVQDQRIPPEVRDALVEDYALVEAMLEKLEQGHIHVAAFGRVSVGKSATLNALLGERRFSTSPLHGETKASQMGHWDEYDAGGIFLVDTPGLNEVEGEERERLAHEVASRSDLILFVVDGDLTDTEIRALRVLVRMQRPILLVFNKVDRYTRADRDLVCAAIARHTAGFIDPRNIVCISALPAERLIVTVDEQGRETQSLRQDPPDVGALRTRLWELLETEGKTLAALNATLFASDLSDQVAQRILKVKRKLGQRLIRSYCIAKGVAVALNPIPVADLLAALAMDVGMVVHLSRLFGLPLSRREGGALVKVIATQLTLLMGTVWAVNLISSALKLGTGGLSTVLTGTAQGAVAYYSTFVVGQAAEVYLAQGKSWGELGPKQVIRGILEGIDRDSVLAQARTDIAARLRRSS